MRSMLFLSSESEPSLPPSGQNKDHLSKKKKDASFTFAFQS